MSAVPRRAMLAPGRFRLLLVALLLLIVGTAASAGSAHASLIDLVLLAGAIVVALLELHVPGQRRIVPVVLAAASTILASLVNQSVRLVHMPVLVSAVVAVFAGLVVWLAFASVMRPHRPVGDRIFGAICVYILMGLAWAGVYETLDGVMPGSFRFPAETGWGTPDPTRYRYFSFVTLATLGYGDVTPVTALGGTLAALEAVSGQLYIGITVARLVALSLEAHAAGAD